MNVRMGFCLLAVLKPAEICEKLETHLPGTFCGSYQGRSEQKSALGLFGMAWGGFEKESV